MKILDYKLLKLFETSFMYFGIEVFNFLDKKCSYSEKKSLPENKRKIEIIYEKKLSISQKGINTQNVPFWC